MQQHPVAAVLEAKERTAAWLARKTGFTPSYVSRVLGGERKANPVFRAKAAEALGVPAELLFPDDKQMPRRTPLAELGMEAQAAIRECRRACAPLYAAALGSGNFDVAMETQQLAASLRIAQMQARRLTGFAENLSRPEAGLFTGERATA